MMNYIMIAAKFLKRQFIMNMVLIVEVLISVMMLTELFVYVSDRIDNQRAAAELQNDDLFVLAEFEYYYASEDIIIETLKSDTAIDKVGSADVMSCALDGRHLQLGVYNPDLIDIYSPKLSEGTWLSAGNDGFKACPAVVSSDTKLHVGDVAEIIIEDKQTVNIQVVGILANPTQYLLPAGVSDSIDVFISQSPVVLINSAQIPITPRLSNVEAIRPKALFILSDMTKSQLVSKYNKYGSIRPINDMIQNFVTASNELILSEMLLFVLFLLLASIVFLSIEVIHSINCRKTYTIYYLVGMRWKQCIWIEMTRHIVLMFSIVGVSVIMDKYGVLQTIWLSNSRHAMFYVALIIYLAAVFFGTSAVFIRSLLHHDISVSLRNLNGGE